MAPAKNPRNVLQGARNRINGHLFEDIIEAACEYYRLKDLAEIEKTPEPMQPIKDLGQGRVIAHYAKKAQPDFKGTLAGGRAVAFEAKYTETDRMLQSAVNDEQENRLNRHEKMGAACFVLVSFDFRLFYRVPWDVWKGMRQHFGHKYMTPEDAAPYRVRYINGVLDFLKQEEK